MASLIKFWFFDQNRNTGAEVTGSGSNLWNSIKNWYCIILGSLAFCGKITYDIFTFFWICKNLALNCWWNWRQRGREEGWEQVQPRLNMSVMSQVRGRGDGGWGCGSQAQSACFEPWLPHPLRITWETSCGPHTWVTHVCKPGWW